MEHRLVRTPSDLTVLIERRLHQAYDSMAGNFLAFNGNRQDLAAIIASDVLEKDSLRAAAPKLLEACKAIISKRRANHEKEPDGIPPEIKLAYDAIAKAGQ